MKRVIVSLVTASLLIATFALPALAGQEAWHYFGFDETVKPWVAGAESEMADEGTLGVKIGADNGYALLTSKSGGAVWMMTGFEDAGNKVRIGFLARDIQGCQSCVPVVYVGTAEPEHIYQFVTDFEDIGEEWSPHFFDISLNDDLDVTTKVVAIGFTGLDAKYGYAQRQVAIDNLHVTIYSDDVKDTAASDVNY